MSDEKIQHRWNKIVERVALAAESCHRNPNEITIVGVTKYVDEGQTRALFEAGCQDLGESRPQSLWEKADSLRELPIRWHMIGHLQRNKVRRTIPLVHQIHSVDSLRLARQISSDANDLGMTATVFLEANVTGDANKTGMLPSQLFEAADEIVKLPALRIIGLMGMAGLDNPEPRNDFSKIRQLRDTLQTQLGNAALLHQLSMGMSGDFEAAIQEGATSIRVGSSLFPSQAGHSGP